MCNVGIFTTLVYSSPGRLRAQWIIRNLSNMYHGLFFIEPYVTLVFSELQAYSKPSEIFMMKYFIHNLVWPLHVKNRGIFRIQGIFTILPNIYHEIFYSKFCSLDIFRTLVYSELWYILKSKHIQNPAGYLRRSILLRTLCNNSRFRGPIYSKRSHIQK